jgi:hypothetical protein
MKYRNRQIYKYDRMQEERGKKKGERRKKKIRK